MGFGSLLCIGLPKNDVVNCAWLLKHFEENSCALYLPYKKSVDITKEDVQIVYGVPRGKRVVCEKETKKIEEEDDDDVQIVTPLMRWRDNWRCTTGIEQPRTYPIISAWNKDMVHERMKLEGKSQFGLGNVLSRIQINEQQANVQQHSDALPINENQPAKEDFMDEFIDLVKTLESCVSKMAEKLKLAKELFLNNLLIKSVEYLIEKRLKDPSILSQDEDIFGT
uniref:Uncharacterized protein n=1 Tax=Chenopodium quinoa TaxID=63459 RepID=A0A803L301_CHEQI